MAKRKKKKSRGANKPRNRTGKNESKTADSSNKSTVVIKAAWIGVFGSLIVAIVGLVGKFRWEKPPLPLTPGKQSSKYMLELSKPTINPVYEISEGCYFEAPKINVVAKSSNCLDRQAIEARCGKIYSYQKEDELPCVDCNNIDVREELEGRRLVATLDSESFIRKQYKRTPHGLYRAEFAVFDPLKPLVVERGFRFNYVYQEEFQDLKKALSTTKGTFTNIPEISGGLQITKLSAKNTFIYAYIKQEFDFKKDFCISGCFTLESNNPLKPCSFDISLCDRWGEKLSVIFADGMLNNFTIKKLGEEYGRGDVTKRSEIGIELSRGNNFVLNFFKVQFQQFEDRVKCSLYLRHNDPVTKYELPVHERIVDLSVFRKDFINIQLKLWKIGRVKLYALEIAEVPKG